MTRAYAARVDTVDIRDIVHICSSTRSCAPFLINGYFRISSISALFPDNVHGESEQDSECARCARISLEDSNQYITHP
jgi:hypothetical protein